MYLVYIGTMASEPRTYWWSADAYRLHDEIKAVCPDMPVWVERIK